MKYLILLVSALAIVACGKPDPNDAVRTLRRQYELKVDLTVDETGVATYEAKARNLSGKQELKEVTALVRILDADQKPVWQKRIEIDVSDTGPYATASQQYRDEVGELGAWEFFDIILAPDDANSEFQSYREFMRVTR